MSEIEKMPMLIECPHPDAQQKMIICRECMEKEFAAEREKSQRLIAIARNLLNNTYTHQCTDKTFHRLGVDSHIIKELDEALREYGGQ